MHKSNMLQFWLPGSPHLELRHCISVSKAELAISNDDFRNLRFRLPVLKSSPGPRN